MGLDQTLVKIRDIIIETVHPDRIILFGSRATGNFTKESDYDIYIIKSGITNERVITRAVRRALFSCNVIESIDLIASNPEKFEKNKDNPYMISSDVNSQGIILYG